MQRQQRNQLLNFSYFWKMLAELIRYFLVGCAVQGVVLSILLLTRKTNRSANRLLAVIVLIISTQSILSAFDTRWFFMALPHVSKIGWLLPTFVGPVFFLFARHLTRQISKNPWTILVHFIPSLIAFFYLLPYYLKSAAEKRAYLNDFELASRDDFGWLNQFSNFQFLFYLVLTLVFLRRHRDVIVQQFSEIEHLRLRWLRNFTYWILVILSIGTVGFYAKKFGLETVSHLYDYHLHYVLVAVLLYWIGYHMLVQPEIFSSVAEISSDFPIGSESDPNLQKTASPKYQKSLLRPEESEDYLTRLTAFMDEKQPHKIPTLTIQELSEAVGIPKHGISQVINDRLGKNFYDFVNFYRVEEAKRLLLDPEFRKLTQVALSEEAGFNSKATFFAVFKKQTGLTPSSYAKQQANVA